MSGFFLFLTAAIEVVLFPFAWRERAKAKAAERRNYRYTGQRNAWRGGAR